MDTQLIDDKALAIVTELISHDPASKMLGIAIEEVTHERCVISIVVNNKMTNGYELCHGGFIFTLADSALAFACAASNHSGVTANAQIEFVNKAKLHDELTAHATVVAQKGRHSYCDVKITNQQETLIAICRGHQLSVEQ